MTIVATDPVTPVPTRRRSGAGVWILLLVLIAAGAIWYFASYQRTPRVVLITSGDGPYWDPVIAGAQAAADQFDVKLVVDRIKSDAYVQAETMKRRVGEGVDGIAVSPLNASIQANLLADVAAQTTLVTVDSDSPVTGRLLFVGTDNYDAGRSAGDVVKEAIPDGGEVIICLGNPDKENTQHRRQGVIDALLERDVQPGRTSDPMDKPVKGERYTVAATLVDDSDPAKCTQLVGEALKNHPNAKCFVGLLGYSAPAIVAGLEQAGKLGQVKVVGFDLDPKTQDALEKDHVHATILQDQYGAGYHAVRVLADRARGVRGGLPLFQTHALSYRTIRKENLAEARRSIGNPAAPAAAAAGPTTAPSTPAS